MTEQPQNDPAPDPEPQNDPVPEPTEPEPLGVLTPTSAATGDTVYLPQLLSDEYGMAASVARETIMLGEITVDGEPWTGDKLDIPRDAIVGKEIVVRGQYRAVRFTYSG